jgi:hypothetical protein
MNRYNMSHLLPPPESVGSNPNNSGNSNNGGARGGNNNGGARGGNNNGGARGGNNNGGNNKHMLNRKIAILETYLAKTNISQTNRNASQRELFNLYKQKYGNGTNK